MKQCECRKAWFTKSCTRNKAIEAVQLSVGSEVKAREAVDNVMDSAYYEELWPHPFDQHEFACYSKNADKDFMFFSP